MRFFLIPIAVCLLGCLPAIAEEGFVPLFNGRSLAGWTSARELAGEQTPFKVNAASKTLHVYRGEKADSEQQTDCLNTEKEYSHFILKMEYKWLEKRFAPRTNWDRDAGLLFHVHGNLKKIWPLCLEMQIGESPGDKPNGLHEEGRFHSGDLFVLGRDLRVDTKREKGSGGMRDYWDPKGKLVNDRHCPTRLGVEVPKSMDDPQAGWNQIEIRVHGADKAVFILNGEVVLELGNFTQLNDKGERVPLDKGRIGLQAEWAEILYRNIRIMEFNPGEVPEVAKLGATAVPDPLYTECKPHRDGIGKVFMGREISQVMGHQAAGWLERPNREREERTDLAIKALKLKPGEVVADIGCGTGYYASRMAEELGAEGKVYGVEIQQEMLDMLAKNMKQLGINNVEGHMGEPNNPKLAVASCDMIIMVDVYHEFEFPYEMTRHMISALKPGGRLVLIEYRMEDPEVRIKRCHKMSEVQVKAEMAIHPEIRWVETFTELPQQHLIVFSKS